MRISVGQAALTGEFATYASRFTALEVSADPARAPRPATLARWRGQANEDFAFSVVLPPSVMALHERATSTGDVTRALEIARDLKANWLLLRTPPAARPDTRVKQRLRGLVELLTTSGHALAWEPAGLWDARDAAGLAGDLGVTLVSDLGRVQAPTERTVYTRLRGNAVPSEGQLLHLLERIAAAEQALVIVEGRGAERVQRWLQDELSFLGASSAASE